MRKLNVIGKAHFCVCVFDIKFEWILKWQF